MAARRTRSLTAVALIALALAPSGLGQSDPGGPAWVQGTGTWGQDGQSEPANATWLLVDQEAAAYHIVTESGIQVHCTQGNGTLTTPAGNAMTGRCSGETSDPHTLLAFNPDQPSGSAGSNATAWSGTFAAGAATPLPTPEQSATFTLVLLAAVTLGSLAGAGVLVLLFVRERRLTGHLARRLWERTRGKGGSKHPESLEQENVRRILVRSKN